MNFVLMLVIKHLGLRPVWFNSYTSELLIVVNEPIYNSNSYFFYN